MHITEHSTPDSYKVVGDVAGVLKMTGKDKQAKTKPLPGEKVSSASDIKARLVFQAPAMVRWSRHDQEGNTNFISAFYLLPLGFGRTRFMSRCVSLCSAYKPDVGTRCCGAGTLASSAPSTSCCWALARLGLCQGMFQSFIICPATMHDQEGNTNFISAFYHWALARLGSCQGMSPSCLICTA